LIHEIDVDFHRATIPYNDEEIELSEECNEKEN
jgi:hypothetical protein